MMSETIAMKNESGQVCPHKFAFMLDNWIRRWIQNPRKILRDYIREGDTVIDMGCGPGFFSIDMAKMVGEGGSVIAVDLQKHMLMKVKKKAERHGVLERMQFHQCESDAINLHRKVDFMLAFYMVHETPNPYRFMCEMKDMLKSDARFLVVEPKMHVSQQMFDTMCIEAERAGLKAVEFPTRKGDRSVLFGVQ
jgi:ubiquinone/menaquinone biosynthesis C-methylase UbiE